MPLVPVRRILVEGFKRRGKQLMALRSIKQGSVIFVVVSGYIIAASSLHEEQLDVTSYSVVKRIYL